MELRTQDKETDKRLSSIENFGYLMHQLIRTDRDVILTVSGSTGSGKSCFLYHLHKAYAKASNTHFGLDRITWSKKELLKWIDGEGEDKKGQLPEFRNG